MQAEAPDVSLHEGIQALDVKEAENKKEVSKQEEEGTEQQDAEMTAAPVEDTATTDGKGQESEATCNCISRGFFYEVVMRTNVSMTQLQTFKMDQKYCFLKKYTWSACLKKYKGKGHTDLTTSGKKVPLKFWNFNN